MLRLSGTEDPLTAKLPVQTASALADAITAQRVKITSANAERNNSFFEEEMEKLDNWAEDVKAGLEKELRDIDAEIKLRKSESKKTLRLDEKCGCNALSKTLKSVAAKNASIFIKPRMKLTKRKKPFSPRSRPCSPKRLNKAS